MMQNPRAILHSSQSVEWFTPPEIVEPCREVLGGIELDPASCPIANLIVKADRFYTEKEDGLVSPWDGKFFCNPPYGKGTRKWPTRAIHQYVEGVTPEGILLMYATPDREWFQQLWAHPICFLKRRVRFYETIQQWTDRFIRNWVKKYGTVPHHDDMPDPPVHSLADGKLVQGPQPTHGNVLIYLGPDWRKFDKRFAGFGHIALPRRNANA